MYDACDRTGANLHNKLSRVGTSSTALLIRDLAMLGVQLDSVDPDEILQPTRLVLFERPMNAFIPAISPWSLFSLTVGIYPDIEPPKRIDSDAGHILESCKH